jgi:hypothetical protein
MRGRPIARWIRCSKPDQVDALLPRIALQAVEHAQRLELGVRSHGVNVLFRIRRACPKQLHLALDPFEVPRAGERPGEFVGIADLLVHRFGDEH